MKKVKVIVFFPGCIGRGEYDNSRELQHALETMDLVSSVQAYGEYNSSEDFAHRWPPIIYLFKEKS